MKRRDFVGASLAGLLGGALPSSFAHALSSGADLVELRRQVGLFVGRGGTIGWLANRTGTVVVDSQYPDTAALCISGLRARNSLGVDALINSHHHGDHTGGNGVFQGVAREIVAHARVPELQRAAAAANPSAGAQTYAGTTFDRDWCVEVGDETVRARHYGAAHTGADCTVFFEQANVVHMGDLVFNRAYPFVDRGGGASVRGWVDTLEAVAGERSSDTLYVFGHAHPEFGVTGNCADVLVQRDFLSAVLEEARRAIGQGKSREEAIAVERLPAFPHHRSLTGWLTLAVPLGAAYDELTERG